MLLVFISLLLRPANSIVSIPPLHTILKTLSLCTTLISVDHPPKAMSYVYTIFEMTRFTIADGWALAAPQIHHTVKVHSILYEGERTTRLATLSRLSDTLGRRTLGRAFWFWDPTTNIGNNEPSLETPRSKIILSRDYRPV